MWKGAAILFTALFVASPIVIEEIRYIVHVRRERRNGLGGTQDIAMWGTFVMFGFGILAVVCWGFHLVG
ncbi:MAG: hypothetical protein K8T89_15490 [Planctomycetes bacterium]|nr:hypothetical protein [Planctomycetota bacterium]